MDDIKDIQQNVFSRLLDPSVQTNPFGSNRSAERAYRRAERIVAGVVLLTNHMDAQDDLRRSARRVALSLLTHTLALKDEMRSSSSPKVLALQAAIRHLISLLKMMGFAGSISVQNAEIISQALEELNIFLSASARSTLTETLAFSKDDLTDVREEYKGHIKDIKDRQVVRDKKVIKDIAERLTNHSDYTQRVLSLRSQEIVSVLKNGGELNMPDIVAHLPEYGGKTLQRELAVLVERGIVKRNGLKRWSKYSLLNIKV